MDWRLNRLTSRLNDRLNGRRGLIEQWIPTMKRLLDVLASNSAGALAVTVGDGWRAVGYYGNTTKETMAKWMGQVDNRR